MTLCKQVVHATEFEEYTLLSLKRYSAITAPVRIKLLVVTQLNG